MALNQPFESKLNIRIKGRQTTWLLVLKDAGRNSINDYTPNEIAKELDIPLRFVMGTTTEQKG